MQQRDYLNKYTVSGSGMVEMANTKLYQHFLKVREEVLKHKWYESEKAHHDVGFEYALIDWVVNYKSVWDKQNSVKTDSDCH